LAEFGLEKQKEITWLNEEERKKLVHLGNDVLESTILSDLQYSSFGKYHSYSLHKQSFNEVKNATHILDGVEEVFKTEHLPNIKELIAAGRISLDSLIKLRRKSTSKKFRSWLVSNSLNDSEYISKEYVDEIANHKGFFETTKGKFIKTIGMYGIGGTIGTLLGGVDGTFVGIAASQILKPTGELGLSFIDTYFLDGLLKGWHPRLFINEYEKLVKEVKIPSGKKSRY
jgi:hypothetical protein